MLLKPTLVVKELMVLRGASVAYRARFRKGINIIAGENSSGKSTLLNLLVYALGADVTHWSEHAKLCDRVRVEVELNGRPAVFSREISERSQQGMDIFAGTLDVAERAPVTEWMRYPYRASGSRVSFSQAVFQLLDIPELETETTGRITLHQILRLLYSDQMTPAENIFRSENFDSPTVREAVGRFLFGAYDSEIYANEVRLKALRNELQDVNASLRSLYLILGKVEHSLTLEWVRAERSNLENRLKSVYAEIARLEQEARGAVEALSLRPQEGAFKRVQEIQAEIRDVDQEMGALELEIADSDLFLLGLERKISALQDSSATADVVAEIRYIWCPSCLSRLPDEENGETCRLCKAPFDRERTRRRIVSQMNEIRVQLEQSEGLQKDRRARLVELGQRRQALRQQWADAEATLRRVEASPTSEVRARIRELTEQAGYVRREIEAVDQQATLIQQLDEMSKRKEEISAGIAHLEDRNDRLRATEQERLAKGYREVADETVLFLKSDLPRQDSFQNPRIVNFSFEKDRISIDGQSYFSASSTVLLKNSFLAGFLFAAARDANFRHLRITILDTLEDKGMEPERSQNFQRLLVDRSAELEADHQLIFATAMVAPEFVGSELIVGEFSTHDQRTLQIG
ncbi:MAG TPA: AAA family ATPase [Allosphingosinicella sp.]|jgi:hypothetical protein